MTNDKTTLVAGRKYKVLCNDIVSQFELIAVWDGQWWLDENGDDFVPIVEQWEPLS